MSERQPAPTRPPVPQTTGSTGRFLAGLALGLAALAGLSLAFPAPQTDPVATVAAPVASVPDEVAPAASPPEPEVAEDTESPAAAIPPAPPFVAPDAAAPVARAVGVPLGSEFGRAGDRAPIAPVALTRPADALADAAAPPPAAPDPQPATETGPRATRPSAPTRPADPPTAGIPAASVPAAPASLDRALPTIAPTAIAAPARDDTPALGGAFAGSDTPPQVALVEPASEPLGSLARTESAATDPVPAPDLSLPPGPEEWIRPDRS